MEEKKKSMIDRAKASYRSRMADLRKLWGAYQNGQEDLPDLGSIYDYGLSFDYVPAGTFKGQKAGYYLYQISWGGPSEEFRFYTDRQGNPYKIEFWHLDWFEGQKIEPSEADFSFLADLFKWLIEGRDPAEEADRTP